MALSWQEQSATANQATITVNINYLSQSDINLEVNDVPVVGFTWDSATVIRFPGTITIAAGDKLAIVRRTNRSALRLLFSEGAAFTRDNLDEQNTQFLYLAQELVEGRSIDGFYGDISMNGFRITDLGLPSAANDATNKSYVDDLYSVERAARISADNALGERVTNEVAARIAGDLQVYRKSQAYTDSQVAGSIVGGQSNVGFWLPSTVSLMSQRAGFGQLYTRGFYASGDGGSALWKLTGNVNLELAGTHVPSKAVIYDAAGNEYALSISSGEVSILANGAKAYTYAECWDTTTDDFVCAGEVVRGIVARLPLAVSTANNEDTFLGAQSIKIVAPNNRYRIGKRSMEAASGVVYELGSARFMVCAGKSYTYKVLGVRLQAIEHGYYEIQKKWEAVGRQSYWGSVSLQGCVINGGIFIGDHLATKAAADCSAGVGLLLLNPEGVTVNGTIVRQFNWCAVAMPAQLSETVFKTVYGNNFDDNEKDYRYVLDYMSSAGVTSRFGNFYRVNFDGCKFDSGRRGVFRDACDWGTFNGGEITNTQPWLGTQNVSGDVPDFLGAITGTGFTASGSYISPGASWIFNPKKATIYTSARNHSYRGCYTEWSYNVFMVSAYTFVGAASRLQGLDITCVSTYKDNFLEYGEIIFEKGCFATVSDNGTATYPTGFAHFDLPTGMTGYGRGSPTRDLGAFMHGGFDFRYAGYNVWMTSGTDWDSWRDRPYAKEMFNPYGLQVNSGTVFLPWRNPSLKSMTCIWIWDPTDSFDPRNVVAWQTAASQEGAGSDEALYKSFGEHVYNYNNGYKMLMLSQKRLTAWDGLFTFGRNTGIVITIPSATPIALIAVEAYTGGIPFFPAGLGNYLPESAANSSMSTLPTQVGADGSLGGGLFLPGDRVAPWAHVRRTQTNWRITPALSSGYTTQSKLIAGGMSLETAMKPSFNAVINSVDSASQTTTITVPTAQLPYVAVGIPIYISSGSSTGFTGQAHLHRRVMTNAGLATAQYVVNGVLGAAGDTLAIDQTLIPSYTYPNDAAFDAVTGTTMTFTGLAQASAFRGRNDLGAGYNGASGVKSVGWYFNGGTTATHTLNATSAIGMVLSPGGNFAIDGNVFPTTDNARTSGQASARWSAVYSVNGAIQTSDEDYKTELQGALPEALLDAFDTLEFDMWKMKDAVEAKGSDGARWHVGFIAQRVRDALIEHGLDWTKFGLIGYDEWPETPAVYRDWDEVWEDVVGTPAVLDEDGVEVTPAVEPRRVLVQAAGRELLQPARPAGSMYSLRMDQCLVVELACQRRKLARLNEKVGG